ncbi:UbiA prenyltransferase family protein [Aquimarina sp. M1]
MKTLKNIFSFYINSSIHVALAIVALVKLTFLKFEILGGTTYIYFSFVGAIVAYNFVKYANISKLYHRRLTKSMTGIKIITVISAIVFIYYGYQVSMDTWMFMFPFVVLTILYATPIFPNKKNLRSVAGIKIFIIGVTWAGITAFIPIVYAEGSFRIDMIIEIIQRFLFIVVIMLPFEIRDLQYDQKELETIPQKIGINRTKVFGSIVLMIFLLITVFKDELYATEIISTVAITIVTLLFLWGTDKKQSEYFCSFWVESIPIMWLVVWYVMQNLLG